LRALRPNRETFASAELIKSPRAIGARLLMKSDLGCLGSIPFIYSLYSRCVREWPAGCLKDAIRALISIFFKKFSSLLLFRNETPCAFDVLSRNFNSCLDG